MTSSDRKIVKEVKYVFLHFLQALFSLDTKYTWHEDIDKTKIVIGDKRAMSDLSTISIKKPTIILNRGNLSWANLVRGQDGINAGMFLNNMEEAGPMHSNKTFTDLLSGQMMISVLSRNGIEAEDIAEKIFINMTGFKDQFRAWGVKTISNLSIGQEQSIITKAEEELIGVNLTFGFTLQPTLVKRAYTYNCKVYVDSRPAQENHDYKVLTSGDKIEFFEELVTGSVVTISYIDAVTLESKTGTMVKITSKIYEVPSGGKILGYYYILNDLDITYNE